MCSGIGRLKIMGFMRKVKRILKDTGKIMVAAPMVVLATIVGVLDGSPSNAMAQLSSVAIIFMMVVAGGGGFLFQALMGCPWYLGGPVFYSLFCFMVALWAWRR